MTAISDSNLNVGGKVVEENGLEFVVRGVGLVKSLADLEMIVLMTKNGAPIYLKEIATVQIGGDFRRGALDVDGQEVVGGTVVMRTGQNAMEVIRAVKEKIAQITPSLPAGVTIRSFYDRSELIDRTIGTQACVARGDYSSHVGSYPFPVAFSEHSHCHVTSADFNSGFVYPDEAFQH